MQSILVFYNETRRIVIPRLRN